MTADFREIEAGLGLTGKYRIVSILARGGMGVVYRATQVALERDVALKVLRRSTAWHEDAEARFLHEAQLAARIGHPNVVRVLDSGGGPIGLYIASDLVEGSSLRQELSRGLALTDAVDLLVQALSALQAIHDAGAVHRDVKPENMLVTCAGELRLTDFGIAKDLTGGIHTKTGVLFGTPAYMSPEHCQGKPVSPASDIYSLGVVLYEALTRKAPFDRPSPVAVIEAHLHAQPAAPSKSNKQLPAAADAIVLRALQKDPARRYGSAAEFAESLTVLRTLLSGTSRPPAPAYAKPTVRASSSHGRPAWAVPAAAALLICSGLAAAFWPRPREAAPSAASAPAQAAAPRPIQPPRPWASMEPLVAGIAEQAAAETRIEALVSIHPQLKDSWLAEIFVAGASSMLQPRLRVTCPGAAPKLIVDTAPTAGNALLATRPAGPGVWTAEVPEVHLRDGWNRIRIVPGQKLETGIGAELTFARPADFPIATLAAPAVMCPECCPTGKQMSAPNDEYSAGRVYKALRLAREILAAHPTCGDALLSAAWALSRIAEESERWVQIHDAMGAIFSDDDEKPADPPWKCWFDACDYVSRAIQLYPGWGEPWRTYADRNREAGRNEAALRAARWAVLLQPSAAGTWHQLVRAEVLLAQAGRAELAAPAVEHAYRGLALADNEFGRSVACLALGEALEAAGRPKEARGAYEKALLHNKSLQPALWKLQRLKQGK